MFCDFYNSISLKQCEINSDLLDCNILGGKGMHLYEMCRLGMKVPPGFIITTNIHKKYIEYFQKNAQVPEEIVENIKRGVLKIQKHSKKIFGISNKNPYGILEQEIVNSEEKQCDILDLNSYDSSIDNKEKINNIPIYDINIHPLLLSVRSGAPQSMPGMMETVLNIGINDDIAEYYAEISNNPRFVYDVYRRLMEMYGHVVVGISKKRFEDAALLIGDLSDASTLKKLIVVYKGIYIEDTGQEFPQDIWTQLVRSITSVFLSWNNDRAIHYRYINKIKDNIGTAVNIQTMVFGNYNEKSYTGVMFSRNPSNGEREIFGEYLGNAQGEDIVSGHYNAKPLTKKIALQSDPELLFDQSFETKEPELFNELKCVCNHLEKYYKDMQDIEFTIEDGELWILQTRNGKRASKASIKIAADMIEDALAIQNSETENDIISIINKIENNHIKGLMHPVMKDSSLRYNKIAKGLPASPGVVSGAICLSTSKAEEFSKNGLNKLILVKNQTSPDDIRGMTIVLGILTATGGMTSHAAVVARGMGKVCVCAANITIFEEAAIVKFGAINIKEGDFITIDGSTGDVLEGKVETAVQELDNNFWYVLNIADKIKKIKVYANAETEDDIKNALKFKAEGIGLCRTEHMFFHEARLQMLQDIILQRGSNLKNEHSFENLVKQQEEDFVCIMKLMNDLPVTIRLLDPPVHEFLPKSEEEIENLIKRYGYTEKDIRAISSKLHEANPMLGNRGARLGITYPEIYMAQIVAIMNAINKMIKIGITPNVGIMIPFVFDVKEVRIIFELIRQKEKLLLQRKNGYKLRLGAMIEIPRAALLADQIAAECDFISFGTNDLTQMTFGISRDDSSFYEEKYIEMKIIKESPFEKFDKEGVGQLIRIAIEKARSVNPNIDIGVCGENCIEREDLDFFISAGANYISCSPYRIPMVKLGVVQKNYK